jgi:hypothetical protein
MFLLLFVMAAGAQACRYTVREIGFSQAGSTPYRLYIPVENGFPQESFVRMQKTAQAALLDANITAQVVQHSVLDTLFLLRGYDASEKNAILVSPQGQILEHSFSTTPETYKQDVWDILEWACLSPLRDKINETLVHAYAAVLLIHGEDATANATAANMAKRSMAEIEKIMPSLPKPISHPPVLIELEAGQLDEERLLLRGLGTASTSQKNPRVAILYGRCRRLGPVLQNEQLTEQNLLNLMALIGADCECGLDRSWILGVMLPTRWGASLQQAVAGELGFDVENPAVRMEMEQILAVSASGGSAKSVDVLAGYREGLACLLIMPDKGSAAAESKAETPLALSRKIVVFSLGGIALVLLAVAAAGYYRLKMKKAHD